MAENPLADPPKPKATFPILEADAVVDAPPAYHPKDAIAESFRSAKFTGAAGLLLAAVQNTLARENVGAFGVFTKFGGTIALFTAMGGTFAFVSTASANLREKEDAYNPGLGGFFCRSPGRTEEYASRNIELITIVTLILYQSEQCHLSSETECYWELPLLGPNSLVEPYFHSDRTQMRTNSLGRKRSGEDFEGQRMN